MLPRPPRPLKEAPEEELIANRRQADLSELQRAFGEFDRTGAELARQQLLDYLASREWEPKD